MEANTKRCGGHRPRPFSWLPAGLLALALLSAPPSSLAAAEPPVGASVAELLELARRMNPERAAAALDADAASARAEGSGALPDPTFQITLDEISQTPSGLPGRVAVEKFTLRQEVPWWGKRELQREVAGAETREARARLADVEAEIALRIKSAYADYHRIHLSMDQTSELIQILRAFVRVAQLRYAQGMSTQQEATAAEAERGAMDVELVRLGKERSRIRARMNALVNRKPDAAVVEHPHLRPLPAPEALHYADLLKKAEEKNPGLTMTRARTEMAGGERMLAQKAWYPDLNLGMGLVQRRNPDTENGFEAMVEVALPLQWSARQARERETEARLRASRERLTFEQLKLDATLRESLLGLEEAREVAKVTSDTLLPQARIALQSAMQGYQTGATESLAVLDAVQRLKKFQIGLLKAEFEAQVRLAELERLIGEEL